MTPCAAVALVAACNTTFGGLENTAAGLLGGPTRMPHTQAGFNDVVVDRASPWIA